MFLILLKSAVIGLAIAAPVGPIGVLCIRRTLAYGMPYGFVSGLGAATADAFYGSIIAFGLTAISAFLLDLGTALNWIGGAFLLYLGITTLRAAGNAAADMNDTHITPIAETSLIASYGSTLFLTITNPLTILAFMGIFAGFRDGLLNDSNPFGAIVVVIGVFLGSATWWLLLSGGVSVVRSRFTPGALVWVNRISGAVICAFALRILWGGLSSWL